MENQRFLLYASLFLVLYLIWASWQRANLPPPEMVSSQPEIGQVAQQDEWQQDLPQPTDADVLDSNVAVAKQAPEVVSQSSKVVRVETDVFDIEIDTRGADIHKVELKNYPVSRDNPDIPLRLLDNETKTYIAQTGLIHDRVSGRQVNELAPNHHDIYKVDQLNYRLSDDKDRLEVIFTWRGDNDVEVTKTYVFSRGSYLIEVNYDIQNAGAESWVGRQYRQLRHSYVEGERSLLRLPTNTGAAYYDDKYEKLSL